MSDDKHGMKSGGAEGNRTPGLVIANDALYQLSYGPIGDEKWTRRKLMSSRKLDQDFTGLKADP